MILLRKTPITIITGFLGSGKTTLISKLIETSASKDKPVVVHNSQNQKVGVISQADLLKAVIEGGDGE